MAILVWGRCKDPSGQAWGLCETQAGPPLTEKDMAVDMEIGSKFDWKYMWKIEDVPTMHCFGEVILLCYMALVFVSGVGF